MGFVRARPNKDGSVSYQLNVYAGIDPLTGKERYVRKTVSGVSRKVAERECAKLQVEVDARGEVFDEATVTVAHLHKEWLTVVGPSLSPSTLVGYEKSWRLRVKPALGNKRLSQVTPALLDSFYAKLLAGGGVGGVSLSPATVKSVHVLLSSMFSLAERWDWVSAPHAVHRARPPQVSEATAVRAPSEEDIRKVLAAAKAARARVRAVRQTRTRHRRPQGGTGRSTVGRRR